VFDLGLLICFGKMRKKKNSKSIVSSYATRQSIVASMVVGTFVLQTPSKQTSKRGIDRNSGKLFSVTRYNFLTRIFTINIMNSSYRL
jgi:hypothetical protein